MSLWNRPSTDIDMQCVCSYLLQEVRKTDTLQQSATSDEGHFSKAVLYW